MKHTVVAAILAISLSASTGCTTMMSDMKASMKQTARMLRPTAFDESPEFKSDGLTDELTTMMREGRPIDESDRESDDWYEKHVMSDEARSIERNLGF